jgi:long-chain acyl-CoA synthetase
MGSGTLCERLVFNATRAPDSVAIETEGSRLTYLQLARAVLTAAGQLRRRGISRGDRVALLLENSAEYVTALYACWAIGALAVPLNSGASVREARRAIEHAGASLVLGESANKSLEALAREAKLNLVTIDRKSAASSPNPADESWESLTSGTPLDGPDCHMEDGALILYTSGTTGNPKGVLLTHRNLAANTAAIVAYLELTAADSILATLPFHYSYGNSVLHTHLYGGAKIVFGASMVYPQKLAESIRQSGVTGLSGVAATFSLLLEKSDWDSDIPRLRYVTQAGGPMGPAFTERLLASLRPETRLFVMYGQTEASARLTWLPPERLRTKLGSVGVPVAGVELTVVDDELKPVAAAVEGEVLVRGDNVMAGYWRSPEQTEQVLRSGWLRTGDVGYLDDDGYLYLRGRRSDMIKTGAHRVSPEEIEEVILELPEVAEVAACGVHDSLLGQVINVVIVGPASVECERRILRHCREQLALHKVPRKVHWRSSLPRTASGKVKRFELVAEIAKESP